MKHNYEIFNADSFVKLKELEDNSVDFILTDTPYNLSKYSIGNMKFEWRSDINNDLADWDKNFDISRSHKSGSMMNSGDWRNE